MNRFDDSRHRVLVALAAVEAAERECFRAALGQVNALAEEAGLGSGQLLVFHAVPRADAVWALDDQDCSREDAVLQAVDLADTDGRWLRLTRAGLGPLPADAALEEPLGATFEQCVTCCSLGGCRVPGAAAVGDPPPPLPMPPPRLGDRFWERAVLTWVDLHRALVTWTGRRLAPTLVVAPETGDVGSVEPLYCPDHGPDFEVVTSLRLAGGPACGDLDAALFSVLDENDGVTPDHVELDLRRWMDGAGFPFPGFAAHGPGACDPPADGC